MKAFVHDVITNS